MYGGSGMWPILAMRLHEQALQPPASGMPVSQQPRRKDTGVVDDEDVAGPEPRRQIGHRAERGRALLTVEDEQPRRAADRGRMLRHGVGGQVVIELVNAHGR
jgi:hypothetical protein